MTWTQVYDPAGHWWLSTLIAALPVIVLLGLLAGLKVRAHLCAIAGATTAVIVAIVAFKMPAVLAVSSFFYGAAFGLLKIVWIVIAAYNEARSVDDFTSAIGLENPLLLMAGDRVQTATPARRIGAADSQTRARLVDAAEQLLLQDLASMVALSPTGP